jgi:hypothetical protein
MVTVSIAAGSEPYDSMAVACVRSLRQNTTVDRIVVYIPESEQNEIPPDTIETFEQLATTECGPVPIDGFPISTKVAAFARAAEYDDDWYVLLDADTIVLNPFEHLFDTDTQLRALPRHVKKPGTYADDDEWREIYQDQGRDYPGRIIESSVDNKPIHPVYNGGVVFTQDRTLAQKWLEIYKDISQTYPYRYADEIALSILSTDYDVDPLPRIANWPHKYYIWTPSNVAILHYHYIDSLLRVVNPRIRWLVSRTGLLDDQELPNSLLYILYKLATYDGDHVRMRA